MSFSCITIDPHQMDGLPCIRGLRIPVKVIAGMIDYGIGSDTICELYPDLQLADIDEALRFAAAQQNEMK